MLFSVDDKHLTKVLREEKQYTMRKFLKEFLNKKLVSWWFESLAGKKSTNTVVLNAFPVVVDHGKCIMLKTLSLFVHSQEDWPHNHHSVRQTAHEAHISHSSVHNIVRKTCIILLFFDCIVTKLNFCTIVTADCKAVIQNGYGGIILLGWCPTAPAYLTAKNYKCSFKFAKIIVKNLLASFLWTQCINV